MKWDIIQKLDIDGNTYDILDMSPYINWEKYDKKFQIIRNVKTKLLSLLQWDTFVLTDLADHIDLKIVTDIVKLASLDIFSDQDTSLSNEKENSHYSDQKIEAFEDM